MFSRYSTDKDMPALETPRSTALADDSTNTLCDRCGGRWCTEDTCPMRLSAHCSPRHTPIVQPAGSSCMRYGCTACNPIADSFPRPGNILSHPSISGGYVPPWTPTWDFWCHHCHRSAEVLPSQRSREGWEYGCPVHGPDVDLIEMECEPKPHGPTPH